MIRVSRLHNEHGKPPTVSSLFNCGTSVAFPKVYVSSTESTIASRVESAEEREERLRRREHDRLRRERETDAECEIIFET